MPASDCCKKELINDWDCLKCSNCKKVVAYNSFTDKGFYISIHKNKDGSKIYIFKE